MKRLFCAKGKIIRGRRPKPSAGARSKPGLYFVVPLKEEDNYKFYHPLKGTDRFSGILLAPAECGGLWPLAEAFFHWGKKGF